MATVQPPYPNPEMLPFAERELVTLTDDVVARNPNRHLNPVWRLDSEIEPAYVLERLGSTCVHGLLLPAGASLESPELEGNTFKGYRKAPEPIHEPLVASVDNLAHISISAHATQWRRDRSEHRGADHWLRMARLHVWYSNGERQGGQLVTVSRNSRHDHHTPFRVTHSVVSPVLVRRENNETGVKYNVHSTQTINIRKRSDIVALAGLYREVLNASRGNLALSA